MKPKYGNQPTCSERLGISVLPKFKKKGTSIPECGIGRNGGGTELRNQELTSLSSIVWRLRLRNVDDLYPENADAISKLYSD